MLYRLIFNLLLILPAANIFSQSVILLEETENHVVFEVDFLNSYKLRDFQIDDKKFIKIDGNGYIIKEPGQPELPEHAISIGIPSNSKPEVVVLSSDFVSFSNKFIVPHPYTNFETGEENYEFFDQEIYSKNQLYPSLKAIAGETYEMRFARVLSVRVSPYQFNPVTRELIFNRKVKVRVNFVRDFNSESIPVPVNDPMTAEFINTSLINSSTALNFQAKVQSYLPDGGENITWYDPAKDWFKIYLNKKDIFRITFEQFVSAGVPLGQGVPSKNLAIYHQGTQIPIRVFSAVDSIFGPGDYVVFAGYPVPPTAFSKQNIYNLTNVYWFTYQEKTGLRYRTTNGFPQAFTQTVSSVIRVDHYEEDKIYERLGYAPNENRDYWYWARLSARNGASELGIDHRFDRVTNFNPEINQIVVRSELHGLTTTIYPCNYIHSANFYLNEKFIGNIKWNGQEKAVFEKTLNVATDSLILTSEGNRLKILLDGDVCLNPKNDEVRLNWYQIQYWAYNRANSNKYFFTSPPGASGRVRYWVWAWQADSMIVYSPSRGVMITNPMQLNNANKDFYFMDSTDTPTDYFCVSPEYFATVDSIRRVPSSSLSSSSNGADYIIITHPDFLDVAQRLTSIRSNNFPDKTIPQPRIYIADVFDIYNEFSAGLMDPNAIRDFVRHTLQNWVAPAPKYVVLLGDMSYDYRKILPNSRPNFIPSIPFHSLQYGQAASDNAFAAVIGSDVTPDLAIGRISIETSEEGHIFLDKLENYPSDPGKKWKENVLLLGSGIDEEDEVRFGFNRESMKLKNQFMDPFGFDASMVFRFPNEPQYLPYKGSTLEIRREFDKGAVLANYYGHGGGYQWDLTFLNNDIYVLQNGGRLPLILSVTCYTAHFDNQDVFGEQFMKVPNKGAIGFYGSSGLTHWQIGTFFNTLLFDEIFSKKVYISGDAIWKAKTRIEPVGYYRNQVALLTYLGDPALKLALPDKADFVVNNSDIIFNVVNPLSSDTIDISVSLKNVGILEGDSLLVTLRFSADDTTGIISSNFYPNFGNTASITERWVPGVSGLVTITAEVNLDGRIPEDDISDNQASNSIAVFNISEPVFLRPQDGFVSTNGKLEFLLPDNGYYVGRNLQYFIEIDTAIHFTQPLIVANNLNAVEGLLKYESPVLPEGNYYWRARIFDGENLGRWTTVRTFQISQVPKQGYYLSGSQLNMMRTDNIEFSNSTNGLVLNTKVLYPKPSNPSLIDEYPINNVPDFSFVGRTVSATDGKYIYISDYWWNALQYTVDGKTKIYKIGTGNYGTVKGESYGTVPNFQEQIRIGFVHHGQHLYVGTISPFELIKVNTESGEQEIVNISAGLLNYETGTVDSGYFRMTTSKNLVYNLAEKTFSGRKGLVMRVFDPADDWKVVHEYNYPNVSNYLSLASFFIVDDHFYLYENLYSGYMRAMRISDGESEGDWIAWNPEGSFSGIKYFAWTYNEERNEIYATVFRRYATLPSMISVFSGSYLDSRGTITSPEVTNAYKWNKLNYEVAGGNTASEYKVRLFGYNSVSRSWDTLATSARNNFDMSGYSSVIYPRMQTEFYFSDTSFSTVNPLYLKSLHVEYDSEIPDVMITNKDFAFTPDSLLQGYDITLSVKVNNLSKNTIDSCKVEYTLNDADNPFFTTYVSVPPDSFTIVNKVLNTSSLIFTNRLRALLTLNTFERFTYNNLQADSFFVARDSVNPQFRITFNGEEILDGDIIPNSPEIMIYLKDNSPLPLDTTNFTIIYRNNPLIFANPDLEFSYTPYPNSEARVLWTPKLAQGRHVLDVLGKDASNNFFDTTFNRSIFFVYDEDDIARFYNYPNPFKDDTHFTFELRGQTVPDEMNLKLFTVAGRLIRDLSIPSSEYRIGFNTVYWDGRDQDGDEIANGVYLLKVITKYPDKTKTQVEKIVKMK